MLDAKNEMEWGDTTAIAKNKKRSRAPSIPQCTIQNGKTIGSDDDDDVLFYTLMRFYVLFCMVFSASVQIVASFVEIENL